MTPTELENGKTVFQCLLKGIGEEAMRKLQTMLNHGKTNDELLGAMNFNLGPDPAKAKELIHLCLDYMRQEMPIAPWRGR